MARTLSVIQSNKKTSTPHHIAPGRAALSDQFLGRASVITLGCAKNQVDSEVMIGVLQKEGFEITNDLSSADVAVINTCGFLQSAVQESIDCIMEVSALKEEGSLRRVIVAGCAVERYREELKKALPEVDEFVTLEDILKIGSAARGEMHEEFEALLGRSARPYFIYDEKSPRTLGISKHYAYVKVSEGCNRPCTFCIIPKIRGEMRSRAVSSIVAEAQALANAGVREINLVAQDLTSYGLDRKESKESLSDLLMGLNEVKNLPWIRLLYAYPVGVTAELLHSIRDLPRVVEYLDIPLQHASESLLKEMKRPLGKFGAKAISEFIKTTTPEVHIRTTFIVGFPGETEADVVALENLVSQGFYSSVGVFTYSAEKGTPAAEMPGQIPEKEKKLRRERIMKAQAEVVRKNLAGYIGSELEVLVDGTHEDTDMLFSGRSRFQAPEVDSSVIINDAPCGVEALTPGALVKVRIEEVSGYDMIGSAVKVIQSGTEQKLYS